MPTATKTQKVECLNPNTGRRMNIDKSIYELFSKAIIQTLREKGAITFTQLVEGVHDRFKQEKISFDGKVEWYTVSVKNDMHARDKIDVYTEKGKKLHRIK